MKKTLAIGTLLLILALTTLTIPKNVTANTTGDLIITDSAGQQTTLTYDQIMSLPSITEEATLSCYGSLVANGQWTGVKISDLLNYVSANTAGGSIDFIAQDGYKISIPLETAMQSNVLLAYAFDSSPLQETYRLVVPEANGNVWISLVVSMTVSSTSAPAVLGRSVSVFDATQDFTQNTPQKTSSPTPPSTVKPSTPTPEPSVPVTVTPSATPMNTSNTSTLQSTTRSVISIDPIYLVIAGLITLLIVASSVAVTQKRRKADLSYRCFSVVQNQKSIYLHSYNDTS